MSERKYICAFTAMGSTYPEYMNVYRYGDEVEVTIREPHNTENGGEGYIASVRFPAVVFELMLEEARGNLKE